MWREKEDGGSSGWGVVSGLIRKQRSVHETYLNYMGNSASFQEAFCKTQILGGFGFVSFSEIQGLGKIQSMDPFYISLPVE